jgi:bifunctional enzyme CysN/CysC
MGYVIWLTGLPAAGKTTIAVELERILVSEGRRVARLDGDELRRSVSADLGYSLADRSAHARRVADLAARGAKSGAICIAALISPLRVDRALARTACASANFFEVYVATPLAVCRQRDAKQLYARADRGEIADVTGVSSPYEPPESPDAAVHPEKESVTECVARILALLRTRDRRL